MVGQVDEGRLVAGRYRLIERIGRGGMGTVWRAEDELLGRQVAVKKLHPPQPHMMDDELATLFERTRREARAAARISHPNVIVVHDVVDDAGLPSIVMEYVPSVTLGEHLKQHGPLTPHEAARVGRAMLAALRAAHQVGVLHRDVKPGNVLLGQGENTGSGTAGSGRVVLTDFGIAQASGTSTLTRTGELIGSIDFLSPERIRGAMPGPESDLWALGATLYQAVEGEAPFRRPTAIETAYAIAEEDVAPAANAGALTTVITGLLAKEPGRRLSADQAEHMLRLSEAERETRPVERSGFARPEPPTVGLPRTEYGPGPAAGAGAAAGAASGGTGGTGGHTPPSAYPPPQAPMPARFPPQTPAHTSARTLAPPPARRRRAAPWIAAAVAMVLLGTGAAIAAKRFRSDHKAAGPTPTTTGTGPAGPTTSAPPTTSPTTPAPPPVPAGYHLARQPDHGYALPVPDGWKKTVTDNGDQVSWVDPTGLVGLKVSALPFASTDPYQHWLTLEPQTRSQVKNYHRERLQPTTRGGEAAAIWQFTFRGSLREWRAIDLGFGKPGGTEYAVYLSAPKAEWDAHLDVFDTAVAGFRETDATAG
ncbi:serine/threonine-protein kinase [Streptomyces sp. HPF1205]|uniref:serine/threonine-protein kinase n=1 Tax=Streptomyces sp. HPF1205 TaxID=2873262 RepID=UPI001CEC4DCE|nr:serine/threonine-protein kinase [Streptomyces sp. HPF1205]